jgi:hypothetical protein
MGNFQHSGQRVAQYSDIFPLRGVRYASEEIDLGTIRLPSVNQPSWVDFKGSQVLSFSDQAVEGNEEIVFFSTKLPAGYKAGTDVYPHVHWVCEDGTAGNVVWGSSGSWANVGEAFPAPAAAPLVGANSLVQDAHNMVTTIFPGAGKEHGSIIVAELRRNSSNVADTLTGKDVYLLQLEYLYEIEDLGVDTLP